MSEINFNNPSYYENRELSWLEFNQRVLAEAKNVENPILERIKFLSIVSSNLDEFFMIRVASLKEQVKAGYNKPDFSGLVPKIQLKRISDRVHEMVKCQYKEYNDHILSDLKKNGIVFAKTDSITKKQVEYIKDYFENIIYPVVTPMAVDSGRPFPLINNKSLNIAVMIKKKNEELFATVQVPSVLPRFIEIPNETNQKSYVFLEDIIIKYIHKLFFGYEIVVANTYRITRNSDLSIDEDEAQDLLREIEESVKKRKFGDALRLEVSSDIDSKIMDALSESLKIHTKDVFFIDGPIDLTFLMNVYGIGDMEHLKYDKYTPQQPKSLLGKEDIFEAIGEKDILLHHPYESFEPIVDFIQTAAEDPNVLAIKQTLYRVSGDSPIIKALEKAAEMGKQVTVLVELKARFDEENNIQWAKKLEQAGCHVIYGLVGLKTHSKVTLVVRLEKNGIKRYVHLGTGNYNDITARFYTDIGILTCEEEIGSDTSEVFNTLSGYSEPPNLKQIVMAPTALRETLIDLIQQEIGHAKAGKKAKIILKLNSICDFEMIRALYKASHAGVKIELIIRGICSLIPGIEKVSHNITVRSIVGKYLEHSRIFYFYNNGKEDLYLSSADLMPRNLNRRVELFFPVNEKENKKRVLKVLEILLKDNKKAKAKKADGLYYSVKAKDEEAFNAQEYFSQLAEKRNKNFIREREKSVFIPIHSKNDQEL
ncbi:polyphosphate kinase [Natranaerovirga hydrolytica]|uniref:Polyphosphate kinase n=1 Tax=Natranaerovirga hydrolytica TaxID=680378 RepID=A0A4R1MFQ2_9FIRM|nr:RNA degradosome polyphosphate kinase [Natranaerovirga hydrolytica]TCK90572.1 polyphosphate kinase [Natranaerovirga hydrolytica]